MNTDFVFHWTVYSFKRLQSASNLALDADVRGALPAAYRQVCSLEMFK